MAIEFEFDRFNPRRMRRGADSVQIKVIEDGEVIDLLWMSKKNIEDNVIQFGTCDAFERGLECYRTGKNPKGGE